MSEQATVIPIRLPGDAPKLLGERARPGRALVLGAILVLIPAVVALAADDVAFRVFMAGLALMLGLAVGAIAAQMSAVAEHTVRVIATDEGIAFVPKQTVRGLWIAAAAAGVLPGLVVVAVLVTGGVIEPVRSFSQWAAVALSALALGWLVVQLIAFRVPRGLQVTPATITGVRGSARVNVALQDALVEVITTSTGAKLAFISDEVPVLVEPAYIGSDPRVVAALLEHFRQNPSALAAGVRSVRSAAADIER